MKVSLARAAPRLQAAPPLLTPPEAQVMLGASPFATPVAAAADTMFGPRGAALAGGALFVCDTGHHRVLGWRSIPQRDGAPADFVIGQQDFFHEGRNGNAAPHAASLNVPTGIAASSDVLVVADAWNHRVLIWHGLPHASRPADVVLGQEDFSSIDANRGSDAPRADTLHWPYGVALAGGRLLVADTGNRRVLVWHEIPARNGAPADLVLGQRDFVTRDENAGEGVGVRGMRWPHAPAMLGDTLLVADAGNNRVMAWAKLPDENGAACDFVLGQNALSTAEHNEGAYYPTATALNMPYGLAVMNERLVIADTANSRLLGFDHVAMGIPASRLAGQDDFSAKGDNRWRPPARDSLCWPYGVAAGDGHLAVCDSGNNRVLLWRTP